MNEVLQIGLLKHGEVLVHGYQKIDSQKVELLVVVFQVEKFLVEVIVVVKFLVEAIVNEEFLFVESVVAEFLVWYQSLDFQGVEGLDFVVWELKSLGQMSQYQTELWQVLVEFVQDLD